jgi:hypothetical protein
VHCQQTPLHTDTPAFFRCRLSTAALVCRRWRALCQAPELLRMAHLAVTVPAAPADAPPPREQLRLRSFAHWLALERTAAVRNLVVSVSSDPQQPVAAELLAAVAASPAAGQLECLELRVEASQLSWPAGLSAAMPRLQALLLHGAVGLQHSLAPLAALRRLDAYFVHEMAAAVHLPAGLTSVRLGIDYIPSQASQLRPSMHACHVQSAGGCWFC